MIRIVPAVLLSCVLFACGGPTKAGEQCTPEGGLACGESSSVGLECKNGVTREFSCRGPAGCMIDGEKVACDLTRAQPGDACPGLAESAAQCFVGDANKALKCNFGTWQSVDCKECLEQGGLIKCVQ